MYTNCLTICLAFPQVWLYDIAMLDNCGAVECAGDDSGGPTQAWQAAHLRQGQDQFGQAGGPSSGLADRRLRAVRRKGPQEVQDLPGDVQAGWRRDRVVLVKEPHGWF